MEAVTFSIQNEDEVLNQLENLLSQCSTVVLNTLHDYFLGFIRHEFRLDDEVITVIQSCPAAIKETIYRATDDIDSQCMMVCTLEKLLGFTRVEVD